MRRLLMTLTKILAKWMLEIRLINQFLVCHVQQDRIKENLWQECEECVLHK